MMKTYRLVRLVFRLALLALVVLGALDATTVLADDGGGL